MTAYYAFCLPYYSSSIMAINMAYNVFKYRGNIYGSIAYSS